MKRNELLTLAAVGLAAYALVTLWKRRQGVTGQWLAPQSVRPAAEPVYVNRGLVPPINWGKGDASRLVTAPDEVSV